jgi:hypothetical protein
MSQGIAVPVHAARHNAQMRSPLQGLTRQSVLSKAASHKDRAPLTLLIKRRVLPE